ncbi:hypothetical protein AcW2_007181 [Taiwanofungus camphoratus]|nr:hypothetical protein AcW2_007181 [Antrodia cinnamomea]
MQSKQAKETGQKGGGLLSFFPRRVKKVNSNASLRSTATGNAPPKGAGEDSETKDIIKDLQGQVNTLQSSLEAALAEAEAKRSALQAVGEARDTAKEDLAKAQEGLSRLQADLVNSDSRLGDIRCELEASKAMADTQDKLIQSLQSQIKSLEAELRSIKDSSYSLRASSDETLKAATDAAEVHLADLGKVKADLEESHKEIRRMRDAHAQAITSAEEKITELQKQAGRSHALEVELVGLQAMKDERARNAEKLENTILHLKREHDIVEKDNQAMVARVEFLERESARSAAKSQEVAEDMKAREAAHVKEVHEAKRKESELLEDIKRLVTEHKSREIKLYTEIDDVKIEHQRQLQEALHHAGDESETITKQLRADHQSAMDELKARYEASMKGQTEQATTTISGLHVQIQTLEAEILETKDTLDALRASSTAATAAAEAEHTALLKAKADLEGLRVEISALETARAQALAETAEKAQELRGQATRSEKLASRLEELQAENQVKSNKLLKLDADVVHLTKEREKAEDGHREALAQIERLEEELAESAVALQETIKAAKVREEDYLQKLDASKIRVEEFNKMRATYAKACVESEELQKELREKTQALKQTEVEAQTAAEESSRKLAEAEKQHKDKQYELSKVIKMINAELENQESTYKTKVVALESERDRILQDAIKHAESEVASAHARDLQAIHDESQATIQQLRTSYVSAADKLKTCEATIGRQEKQLAERDLQLQAAKEHTGRLIDVYTATMHELEHLKRLLEEARETTVVVRERKDELIIRLEQELSTTRDKYAALNDAFNAAKESWTRKSMEQARNLERANRGLFEETRQFRVAQLKERAVAFVAVMGAAVLARGI